MNGESYFFLQQLSWCFKRKVIFLNLFTVAGVTCVFYIFMFQNKIALNLTLTRWKNVEIYTDESNGSYVTQRIVDDSETLVDTNVKIPDNRKSKFSGISKPDRTLYEEMMTRRSKGFFDGILLRNLLGYTEFLRQPKSVCEQFGREMVTLVQSACPHKDLRNAIRETWGRRASHLEIPVVFFVGKCPGIEKEFERFHDVVEVNVTDSYFNNTIKSLARWKWFIENCPETRSLLMADDDTAVMIDLLLEYTRGGIGFSMIGPFYHGAAVVRSVQSKWYIPEWNYPLYKVYPDYLGGWAYVVNGSFVHLLYRVSLDMAFLTVDDVLFTGFVPEMVGMRRIKDSRFPVYKDTSIRCDDTSIFATQFLPPEEIRKYWRDRNNKCGIES